MPERLITNHHAIAASLYCDCYLCEKWRETTKESKLAWARVVEHAKGCRCESCLAAQAAKIRSLAAELRLNLWVELCWYAVEEGWQADWTRQAWSLINRTDRWWISEGQYLAMDSWLAHFKPHGAKETRRKSL